jgi:hypothetical protein
MGTVGGHLRRPLSWSRFQGRVRIESKEEMRKRGVPSPDRADGVMMVFATERRSPDIDVEAHRGESITGDLMTRAW